MNNAHVYSSADRQLSARPLMKGTLQYDSPSDWTRFDWMRFDWTRFDWMRFDWMIIFGNATCYVMSLYKRSERYSMRSWVQCCSFGALVRARVTIKSTRGRPVGGENQNHDVTATPRVLIKVCPSVGEFLGSAKHYKVPLPPPPKLFITRRVVLSV